MKSSPFCGKLTDGGIGVENGGKYVVLWATSSVILSRRIVWARRSLNAVNRLTNGQVIDIYLKGVTRATK